MSSFLEILLDQMQSLPMPGNELAARHQAQQLQAEQMHQQALQQAQMQRQQAPQGRRVQMDPIGAKQMDADPIDASDGRRTVQLDPIGPDPKDGKEMVEVEKPKPSQVRMSPKAMAELMKHMGNKNG